MVNSVQEHSWAIRTVLSECVRNIKNNRKFGYSDITVKIITVIIKG